MSLKSLGVRLFIDVQLLLYKSSSFHIKCSFFYYLTQVDSVTSIQSNASSRVPVYRVSAVVQLIIFQTLST